MRLPAQNDSGNTGRPASRRAMLAGTATGIVAAASAATALSGLSATPASAAVGVTDWLNITDYGADPSGIGDSTKAINNAIAAVKPGGVVYMPTGTFLISSPILLPASVTLIGDHGATSSGDDAKEVAGTVIRVASGFSPAAGLPAAAILCLVQGSASPLGIRLRDFWIDGSGGPAGVDGITCYGPVKAWQAERVGVYLATGNGFNFVQTDGGFPDGQHLYSCLAQQCTGYGFTGEMIDATLIDCHAQQCGADGIYLTGGNTRFIGCRSDLNAGYGWHLDHSGVGDGYSDGIILDGCGTQRNNNHGVFITNSTSSSANPSPGSAWHDPILITGCSFGEDGQNGTSAGIHIEGENHVHISNTLIAVGTIGFGAAGCPQYGIQTATVNGTAPTTITVTGGRIEAGEGGALISDQANVDGNFKISPETVGALGYQSDATYSRQGSTSLSGGSVSVPSPWVSPTSRIFLSTLQTSSPGFLSVRRTASSFTISSTSSSDSSTVAWMLTTA